MLVCAAVWSAQRAAGEELQHYAQPGQLDPLPPGTASLYRTPWRSNERTAVALDALAGIGIYWKHIPATWTLEQQTNVMRQMFAAGVRRARLAPHFALFITRDWTAPPAAELEALRRELRAAKAAGIRPTLTFVHIPPVGRPGTRDLQDWWPHGALMPVGEVGSPQFNAYLDKTFEALQFLLDEARAAGFTGADSYDLEMGQNLWWGAPAVAQPLPYTTVSALKPNGRIYEFDKALIARLRQRGYDEPLIWWSEGHHHFEDIADIDLPDACAGWAFSIYSAWTGNTAYSWLNGRPFDQPHDRGPNDVWPIRAPLRFADRGQVPVRTLARPESYLADRTRRDNLIEFIGKATKPVAITALGAVPAEIPDANAGGFDGWQIKQRALTRALAFWLNQGARFVMLHSAYEPEQPDDGAAAHALLPTSIDPASFALEQAPALRTLQSFSAALDGAQPIPRPAPLRFRYALDRDPVLIPATGTAGPLMASDAVALLPFQIDEHTFAVAAYVVTPNITQAMPPVRATLQIDRTLHVSRVTTIRPATLEHKEATIVARAANATTVQFDLYDDVVWLRFVLEHPPLEKGD